MSLVLPRTARRTAVAVLPVALWVAAALVLSACGASFEAQTYQVRTNAEATNTAVGSLAVRGVTVVPTRNDALVPEGSDVTVTFTVTNDGAEDDRLVEVSSPAADEVEIIGPDRQPVETVRLPSLGTTGTDYSLVLRSVAQDVRPGEFVELTMRFERNGETTIQVPVASPSSYDYDRERSENFHVPGEHDGHGGGGSDAGRDEAGEQSSGGESH